MWIIEDWAGNRIRRGWSFATFEDGWDYIRHNWEESFWEELYVVRIED